MAAIEQPAMVKSFRNEEFSVEDLTNLLRSKSITIPPWQREFRWPLPLKQKLVECILKNDPMPQILLRQLSRLRFSLEDGRQRLSTLKEFREDNLVVNGKKFTQLTPAEQNKILSYPMPVQTYCGYTDEEAVRLFINRQQGEALTLGEKYYAIDSRSPLVRVTRELLMISGSGLHDVAADIWGRLCDEISSDGTVIVVKDKKRRWLERSCAIIAGLAWGTRWITKKPTDAFNIVEGHDMMTRPIHKEGETEEQAQDRIRLKLVEILDIYKAAQSKHKVTVVHLKKQFDPGFATGYIMYGMSLPPERMPPQFKEKWVDFLVKERKEAARCRAIKKKYVPLLSQEAIVGSARTWSDARWMEGHNYIFSDAVLVPPLANTDGEDEDEDEDEDEEDEDEDEEDEDGDDE